MVCYNFKLCRAAALVSRNLPNLWPESEVNHEPVDLNLILNPSLSAEQMQTEKDYIETAVKNAGGEIAKLDDVGNRRLAYAVSKEREGYYLMYTIRSSGNPETSIAASLRLRDNVRRVLVVKDRPEWKTKKA